MQARRMSAEEAANRTQKLVAFVFVDNGWRTRRKAPSLDTGTARQRLSVRKRQRSTTPRRDVDLAQLAQK
jgi:hypothetical protein